MESEELRVKLDCVQRILSIMVWTRPPEDQVLVIQVLQQMREDAGKPRSNTESERRKAEIEHDFFGRVLNLIGSKDHDNKNSDSDNS